MKKYILCFIVCLLLLPACALGEMTLSGPNRGVTGQVMDFSVSGTDKAFFRYDLYKGNEKIVEGADCVFNKTSYLPSDEGEYVLQVSAWNDGDAEAETASLAFTVLSHGSSENGISISGGSGAFYRMGGMRTYRITTPSNAFWTAHTNDDFISISQTCGMTGDLITVSVTPCENEPRSGMITFTCGTETLDFVISQSTKTGIEEEAYLQEPQDLPLIDQNSTALWQNADASKDFTVHSQSPWTAACDADFAELSQQGDQLTVTLSPNEDAFARTALVTVTNQDGCAYLTVSQPPQSAQAEKLQVSLSSDHARSHADSVIASVQTGSNLASLSVQGLDEMLLLYPADATDTGNGLLFETQLPLCGEGEKALYFRADYEDGSFAHATLSITLTANENCMYCMGKEETFSLYSQQDGSWKNVKYRTSNLEHSGCAIFALSHALQQLGYEGESITPAVLADTYAFCLLEGGTMNSTLIGHAGDDLGFKTRYDLYTNLDEILKKMDQGAVFSFAVVNGHIAMVSDVTEDHSMFRIIDSAPSATFERIQNAQMYILGDDGSFVPVENLSQLPHTRYYFETNGVDGAEYYLEARYVAKRGVRLIQPITE